MQRLLGLTLAVLVMTSVSRADDAQAARALIDRAIDAAGGRKNLEKYPAQTWSEKGIYYGAGEGQPYTATLAMQRPDRFRMEIQNFFTMVVAGDKGWVKAGGMVSDMDAEQLKNQKDELYAGEVMSLVGIKDKASTLSLLGETKVGNQPAVGVKVASKGRQDVNLYFDKNSGLLVKAEYTVRSREHGNKEVNQEVFYSDYKDIDGVKQAMKVALHRDGKKFVEAELSNVKNFEKLDDKEFAKP